MRSGSDPEPVSLGRYPEFRDAIEIPLLLERSDSIRADLNRLQRLARHLRWEWTAVVAATESTDSSDDAVARVA